MKRAMRVVIVGRPNVGKSTLFNRLVGRRAALVHPTPGVTRDRHESDAKLGSLDLVVVDTAGLEDVSSFLNERPTRKQMAREGWTNTAYHNTPLSKRLREDMLRQTDAALRGADVALFLVDARQGVTGVDEVFAGWLRERALAAMALGGARGGSGGAQTPRPNYDLILVANKYEAGESAPDEGFREAFRLGLGNPLALSAERGDGIDTLYAALRDIANRRGLAQIDDGDGNSRRKRKLREQAKAAAARAAEAAKAPVFFATEQPQPQQQQQQQQQQPAPAEASDEAAAAAEEAAEAARPVKLAIVGKPNVGKSTLLNRILGEERVLTGEEPGVTRDSISVRWRAPSGEREFEFIDTAGLLGVNRLSHELNYKPVDAMAMSASMRSIERANVVALVVDASALPTQYLASDSQPRELQLPSAEQIGAYRDRLDSNQRDLASLLARQVLAQTDLSVSSFAVSQGRPLLLVANKLDRVREDFRRLVCAGLSIVSEFNLSQVKGLPIVPVSALSGVNVDAVLPAALLQQERWRRRVATAKLNAWLRALVQYHAPPAAGGRTVKVKYITQVGQRPPKFAVFCNRSEELADHYRSFMLNSLRNEFDLQGVPLRLVVRSSDNPYSKQE